MADDEDSTRTRAASSDPSLTASGERRLRFFPGARIGAYVLERPLGEGGMGTVWVARHAETGGELALKLLPIEEGVNTGALERFRREGQAQAAAGAHPNVLRVHACGEQDGWAFLAMELARGGDLKTRLKAGPLEPCFAAEVLRDLARGLAHVHAHGVLHRDLKPGNVVFDEHATPKLMDFGLARLVDAQKLTVTGTLLGTPAYMAPEQAGGEALDERADVYALGAVLFHCLTGRPPFEADTVMVLVRKVLLEQAPRPSALNAEVPPALDDLVLRTLAKAPDKRPPSAGALADELDLFLRGELEATRRMPPALVAAAALAGVTALALVGAAAAHGRGRPDDGAVAALRSDAGAVAAVTTTKRPERTAILSPPLADDGEDASLVGWRIVDDTVERLEVVAAAHADGVELRVDHVDARRAVGDQHRRRVRAEKVPVGELRVKVDLAVGWTSITLVRVAADRVLERRDVVRLPPGRFELLGRTSVRAKVDGSELRLVPPGTLTKRVRPPGDARPEEADVTAPYLLGVREVSWRQLRAYRLAVPGPLPGPPGDESGRGGTDGDDQPANYVSMLDAYGYCDWAGLRLPEDLEWERAALDQTAWNGAGAPFEDTTCPVADETIAGARARFGHWHLLGNVAEWVQAVYFPWEGGGVAPRSGVFGGAFYGQVPVPPNYEQHDHRVKMRDTGFRVAASVATESRDAHRFPP